jgi:hypothetical protein
MIELMSNSNTRDGLLSVAIRPDCAASSPCTLTAACEWWGDLLS